MPIRDFELYHGALLATLVRSHRPVTLRMIETDANDCWSAYILDDALTIYTKHSAHGDYNKTTKSVSWTFTFNPKHLRDLRRLEEEHPVHIALVCGNHGLRMRVPGIIPSPDPTWKEANNEWTAWLTEWLRREGQLRRRTGICFLASDDWHRCLDLKSGGTQSIRVELARGREFLVNTRFHVPQNRLKTWAGWQNNPLLAEIPDPDWQGNGDQALDLEPFS